MHYRIVVPSHLGSAKILREALTVVREEKAMQVTWRVSAKPVVRRRS